MENELNTQSSNEEIQLANKNMNCASSLTIKEMHIKNCIEILSHSSQNGYYQD
jgi:hypothetical protein